VFDRGRSTPSTTERLAWMVSGALLGAAAMYLADPDRGRQRRQALEEHGNELGRQAEEAATRARVQARIAAGEDPALQGAADELTPDLKDPSDAVLLERVRSQAVGHSTARNAGIVTTVEGGVVTLRGQVDETAQRDDLLERVLEVDGVEDVIDLTHLPDEAAPTRS
jgi:osmotically-inducible protein OsmY